MVLIPRWVLVLDPYFRCVAHSFDAVFPLDVWQMARTLSHCCCFCCFAQRIFLSNNCHQYQRHHPCIHRIVLMTKSPSPDAHLINHTRYHDWFRFVSHVAGCQKRFCIGHCKSRWGFWIPRPPQRSLGASPAARLLKVKGKNQNERARNRQLDLFPLGLANEDAAEY